MEFIVVPADWPVLERLALVHLPRELQLHILGLLDDRFDAAALMLAIPPLGIDAMRSYPRRYMDPLFSIALALHCKEPLDTWAFEALLRRYAHDDRCSTEGCDWLCTMAPLVELTGGPKVSLFYQVRTGSPNTYWIGYTAFFLHYDGDLNSGDLVRRNYSRGSVYFFEGEKGYERMVRCKLPNGNMLHYEGSMGEERLVRGERAGSVDHYDGEQGVERLVRCDRKSGFTEFYEGDMGAERLVRREYGHADRYMHVTDYYEGEKGAERWVRSVTRRDGVFVSGVGYGYDASPRTEERPFRVRARERIRHSMRGLLSVLLRHET